MRRPRSRRLPLLLAVLLAGCSLPLQRGVQSATGVSAEQRPQDDIRVIPPGPRDGESALQVVSGFLGAQASATEAHAIARRFLSPVARWDDAADLLVYDPASLLIEPTQDSGGIAQVTTQATVTARIRRDGSYDAQPRHTVTESYSLTRPAGGQWRLVSVPPGLRLTPADRDRSFTAERTYFLAPAVPGESPHLVADPVYLPDSSGLVAGAEALVRRLVAGPSETLTGSVQTAVPLRTDVDRVSSTGAGVIEVGLRGRATELSPAARQQLSAQLIWTLRSLPGFTGLRLRVGGELVAPPSTGTVLQDVGSLASYDPDGLPADAPLYYVDGRRLRARDTVLPVTAATSPELGAAGAVPVDQVAVAPGRGLVALVTREGTLRLGSLKGGSYLLALRRPGLRSPSWGAGGSGVWVLEGSRRLLRVLGKDDAHEVPLEGAPTGLTALAVARDGVRVALVSSGRLLVGRVQRSGGALRVVGLVAVAPDLLGVQAVSWAGATTLVAIGSLQGTLLPVRIAVDGSSLVPLDGPGLPGRPTAVAASPGATVVAADGPQGSRLFRANGSGFTALTGRGTAPAYPG